MRHFLAALAVIFGASPLFADVEQINWADLIDQSVQSYADPFRDLTHNQIAGLRQVVKLSSELEEVNPPENAAATLAEVKKTLSDEGVDADWLISQRWIVADRRKLAREAGNPAKDGVIIKLGGFVIPAPAAEDGTPMAYLVPERGMCSHVPPPPPNQMVRLRVANGWMATRIYEPVVVTGQIHIQQSNERMMVVDGFVSMQATFSMDVSDVQTFDQPSVRRSFAVEHSGARNDGTTRLPDRLRRNGHSPIEKR
ncbi:DUF3299 domain-containing protein [Ruegeria sp. HKCCA0370]|uniref:DUF3299 domain-containing protein n=1 Tax=Ruegeria sp. HKCCA0370 TaxID=2682995 RepID=UPI00148988A5|nr:DUF3299 domain-containing protein [Ruegeria sp. HKCCA0370]